jgi:hypothetical protein
MFSVFVILELVVQVEQWQWNRLSGHKVHQFQRPLVIRYYEPIVLSTYPHLVLEAIAVHKKRRSFQNIVHTE